MASHTGNGVSYYLSLPVEHKNYLGAIRHWENLKVGFDEDIVWVKDLTTVQVDSVEIKSLSHKTIYYANGPSLYKQGSLLPDRTLPSLLWTPVERGLPVQLPSFNHNFFGISEKLSVRLQSTDEEQEAFACLVSLNNLQNYVETAPAIRLKKIHWIIIDEEALLLGTPVLPIQGKVYWRQKDFLLPAGYCFELPLLTETLLAMLNPLNDHWIVWYPDGKYFKVAKEDTKILSIGSFRQTVKS